MEVNQETEPLLSPSTSAVGSVNNEESRVNSQNKWKVVGACLNTVAHGLIGSTVLITLWFAFNSGPIGPFQLHIVLCTIGYQLLMAQGILSLNSCNGWSSSLSYKQRRRMHWILQLVGSVTAIAGSATMGSQMKVHFTTWHAKMAIAASICTYLSLINGLLSLYTVELRRFIPPQLSKLSHIGVGTGAFIFSTIALGTGFMKQSFKKWATEEFAYVMIGVIATYGVIIVATPCLTVWKRIFQYIKLKVN